MLKRLSLSLCFLSAHLPPAKPPSSGGARPQ